MALFVAASIGKKVQDAETREIYDSQATPLTHRPSKVIEARTVPTQPTLE